MYTAAVITVSDKGAAGLREDTAGPLVRGMLTDAGLDVTYTAIVPDERAELERALIKCADELDVALVVTTGGTGFSPRDVTPEATLAVCDRLAPGIPEAMRRASLKITNRAMLTRQQAGLRGATLIVNLPGSPKAARENLAAALPALPHGLEMLREAQRDHVTSEGTKV
jgi:molybdenum cofactor synthesis domain-containing protein